MSLANWCVALSSWPLPRFVKSWPRGRVSVQQGATWFLWKKKSCQKHKAESLDILCVSLLCELLPSLLNADPVVKIDPAPEVTCLLHTLTVKVGKLRFRGSDTFFFYKKKFSFPWSKLLIILQFQVLSLVICLFVNCDPSFTYMWVWYSQVDTPLVFMYIINSIWISVSIFCVHRSQEVSFRLW